MKEKYILSPKINETINLEVLNITENSQPTFLDSLEKVTETSSEIDKGNLSLESESNSAKNKIHLQSKIEKTIETIQDSVNDDLEIQDSQINSNDETFTIKNINKETSLHSSSQSFNSSEISVSNPIKIIPVSPEVPLSKYSMDNEQHSIFSHWEILSCPAQSFLSRLCLKGEMFNIN